MIRAVVQEGVLDGSGQEGCKMGKIDLGDIGVYQIVQVWGLDQGADHGNEKEEMNTKDAVQVVSVYKSIGCSG